MQNINNIIFDYGNVIFDIDFQRAYRAFESLGIQHVEQIYGHLDQNSLFDDFDRGQISAADFRDGIRHLTGKPQLTDEEIDAAWNALLIGVPPINHQLLLEYKKNYRTFLLSNNNELHYEAILKHLVEDHDITDNSRFFEKDYYSHLMGMRKPDREIFEAVLDTHDLKPKETLFIDDSPQHLQTAKSMGMITLMLPSAHYFYELTKTLGLLDLS